MPMALGQRLLLHRVFPGGGIVSLLAIAACVLLIRFWPTILRWWQGRR
ncbi:MAG: hypothetical protein QM729_07555 [Solirubrobacterales bacterium]